MVIPADSSRLAPRDVRDVFCVKVRPAGRDIIGEKRYAQSPDMRWCDVDQARPPYAFALTVHRESREGPRRIIADDSS
jgi:hypothetical protein